MQTTQTSKQITIDGREFTLSVWHADHGWAPEASEAGVSFYLGGEDDEDCETPEAAIEQAERLLRDQLERGN